MIDDVTHHLGAVGRTVRSGERDGLPTRVVAVSQTYDGAVDDVWDALTNPERLPRWFLPVTGDLRVGGRYHLEGNATGEILACAPPSHLAATWESAEEVTWLEVRLTEEEPGRTRLDLEHAAHVDPGRWKQFGPGAVGVGWDLALLGLATHLSGAGDLDPAEAAAWPLSEEGRKFIASSSERWGAANAANGEDEATAAEAAARTTAFYTGQPL
ncbi:SRPBCC family protein [Actinopolymorpha rutila]|uniref:Uncharacterized protein YndB with AHSA1/START domain n=1 Tax=Actinopolymorpha rutila TaxID=446787 RepID=A0A852ZWU3_9ACTN|nr:uncharacterized protein YndB with AHSA1/START domain [Actinopolymorpha rutila]